MHDAIQHHNSEAKRRAFAAVLAKYGEVWLVATSAAPGVRLPDHVVAKHSPRISIQLSTKLVRPTRHSVEAEGIEFDASFNGVYSTCYFPWSAVLIVHGPRLDDGSAEAFAWSPPTEPLTAAVPSSAEARRKAFRVIKGGES